MCRSLLIIAAVFFGLVGNAQKFSTKSGTIDFEASVPSFEEVAASNSNVSAILNTETGEFAALALVQGFRFKVALMEEHFNENYIESSKYPKAVFRGKIADFNVSDIDETQKLFNISGTMTLHGVEKEVTIPILLNISDSNLVLSANFVLKPGDFNIKIPKIVSNKIAEEVNVTANFKLRN